MFTNITTMRVNNVKNTPQQELLTCVKELIDQKLYTIGIINFNIIMFILLLILNLIRQIQSTSA